MMELGLMMNNLAKELLFMLTEVIILANGKIIKDMVKEYDG